MHFFSRYCLAFDGFLEHLEYVCGIVIFSTQFWTGFHSYTSYAEFVPHIIRVAQKPQKSRSKKRKEIKFNNSNEKKTNNTVEERELHIHDNINVIINITARKKSDVKHKLLETIMSHSLREISFFLSHSNTCQMAYYVISLVAYVKCWKWFVWFVHMRRYTFSHIFEMPRTKWQWKTTEHSKNDGNHLMKFVNRLSSSMCQSPKKKRRRGKNDIQSRWQDSWHDRQLLISFLFCAWKFRSVFNVTLNHVE